MELTEKECWFWLCSRPYLGVRSIDRLLGYFGTAQNIYYRGKGRYERVPGLQPSVLRGLQGRGADEAERIKREIGRLEAMGGHFVCRWEAEYPEKLRHIYDSPAGLFWLGELPPANRPMIAVVGARDGTEYGLAAASWFGRELSELGFGIISGLALGIDGAAHRGALQSSSERGKTWGILGCGLNICYPKENFRLFDSMKSRGGIISEYPLDVKPAAWHFPMRNRIISGLADGILVIEAKERSGSLITAELGLEQGKNIYGLPGPFNSLLSAGCHCLIQSGAKLVFRPEDVAEDYGDLPIPDPAAAPAEKLPLDNSEQLVYASLSLTPKDADRISAECRLTPAETLAVLLNLELKGRARQVGKNLYIQRLQ